MHGLTKMSQQNLLGGSVGALPLILSEKAVFCFPTIAGKEWQIPLAQSAPRNPGKQ